MIYFMILQKDKPQRRRPGLEGRLRDNRGNRRDHEWIDRVNDGDRMIGIENSPSHDPQSKSGGLEGGNHDESMYDVYGSAAPSFASDMAPPPVLMPVPGAGFVVFQHTTFH